MSASPLSTFLIWPPGPSGGNLLVMPGDFLVQPIQRVLHIRHPGGQLLAPAAHPAGLCAPPASRLPVETGPHTGLASRSVPLRPAYTSSARSSCTTPRHSPGPRCWCGARGDQSDALVIAQGIHRDVIFFARLCYGHTPSAPVLSQPVAKSAFVQNITWSPLHVKYFFSLHCGKRLTWSALHVLS